MKYMTIRDPFATLPAFNDMNRFLEHFFADQPAPQTPATSNFSTLALDVSEDEHNLIIHASLPGFRKEDVNVEVHDGVLTISASHTQDKVTKDAKHLLRERRTGSFMRSIALPEAVAHDKAEAELKDGVLELRLPKSAEARKSTIAIR